MLYTAAVVRIAVNYVLQSCILDSSYDLNNRSQAYSMDSQYLVHLLLAAAAAAVMISVRPIIMSDIGTSAVICNICGERTSSQSALYKDSRMSVRIMKLTDSTS